MCSGVSGTTSAGAASIKESADERFARLLTGTVLYKLFRLFSSDDFCDALYMGRALYWRRPSDRERLRGFDGIFTPPSDALGEALLGINMGFAASSTSSSC